MKNFSGGIPMKKIIALDIDGTLYNRDKKITPATKEALLQAQENGCILVLASGRPTAGLKPIADELNMDQYHGLLLAYNGGVVTDYTTGRVIYSNTIPNLLARRLLRHLEASPVNPIVDDGTTIYTTDPQSFQVPYESSSNHLNIRQVANVHDAITFDPAKILIAANKDTLAIETAYIKEPFQDELSFVLSAPFYLEATPFGVNKADSMEKACAELGIPAKDVIAFGDAQNDIPMLSFAGTAVAMGNACDALKEIADLVTASNDEDGIAKALPQLLQE